MASSTWLNNLNQPECGLRILINVLIDQRRESFLCERKPVVTSVFRTDQVPGLLQDMVEDYAPQYATGGRTRMIIAYSLRSAIEGSIFVARQAGR